jgi:hypothetical protein
MLAAGLGLAVAVPLTAEVTRKEGAPSAPKAAVEGGGAWKGALHDRPLRLQCWQEGIKVVDQTGLEGLSLSAANQPTTASFKRRHDGAPDVFLMSFEHGLCLVEPES